MRRRHRFPKAAGVLTCAGLATAAVALAQPGDNDPAFSGGDATPGFDARDLGLGDAFTDVAVQSDGRLVATGRGRGITSRTDDRAYVARYTTAGALDATFAVGEPVRGLRQVPGGAGQGEQVAVDSAGRVVVAVVDATTNDVRVVRLTSAGEPDTAFSGDGIAPVHDLVAGSDPEPTVFALAIGPSDSITVGVSFAEGGGTTTKVIRYTAAGALDGGWNSAGVYRTPASPTGDHVVGRDLGVDTSGRVWWTRYLDASGAVNCQLRRQTAASGTDKAIPLPAETQCGSLRVAVVGDEAVVATSDPIDPSGNVRLMRFREDGTPVPGFGSPPNGLATSTVTRATTATLTGVTVLPDGRIVVAGRASWVEGGVPPASGPGVQQFLARFSATGAPDGTFNPGTPDTFASLEGLGQPSTTDVVALGGPVAVPDGDIVTVGQLDGDDGDEAYIARFGVDGVAPVARISVNYPDVGSPPHSRGFARPGEVVQLGATDAGDGATYEWDLDGTPGFDTTGRTVNHRYADAGTYAITLRVRSAGGIASTAAGRVDVAGPNGTPTVRWYAGSDGVGWAPSSFDSTHYQGHYVIFRVEGDDDTQVTRVQLDVDGEPGFERSGTTVAAGVRQFFTVGEHQVQALVEDEEGKTIVYRRTVTIEPPPCEQSRVVKLAGTRLNARAPCWRHSKQANGVEVWEADKTPPPPPDPPAVFSQVNVASSLALASMTQVPVLSTTVINGLYFRNYTRLRILKFPGGANPPQVKFENATVQTLGPATSRVVLLQNKSDVWVVKPTRFQSFDINQTKFAGLDYDQVSYDGAIRNVALTQTGGAKFDIYPLLPPIFGDGSRVSADRPVTITTGAATASQAGTCFTADGANLPGLDFIPGDSGVRVCRGQGPGDFTINVEVDLASFVGGDFLPSGGLKTKVVVEIVDGEFASARASLKEINVNIIGPVRLTGIGFGLFLSSSSFENASCVPKVGVEIFSLKFLRDALVASGYSREYLNRKIPDVKYDFGHPESALCGDVWFDVGFSAVELAKGHVSLGVAKYADARPDALRILGDVDILGDLATGEASAAVYSNAFMDLRATFRLEFIEIIEVDGHIVIQVDPVRKKFNAEAGLHACIAPIDLCAGVDGLISSKGIGACLFVDLWVTEWSPGITVEWDGGFTPYFTGCDLGDVRVNVSGSGSTIVTTVPPTGESAGRALDRARATRLDAPIGRARAASTEVHEAVVKVPGGQGGRMVGVKGQNAKLARFELRGPKGERITADPSSFARPTLGKGLIVGNDEKRGITNILLDKPSAGRWKVVPTEGSVPIVEVVSGLAEARPKVRALSKVRVTARPGAAAVAAAASGRGTRALRYSVAKAPGRVVRFLDRGPTGTQPLGSAVLGSSGELRFTPAPGKRERREIVAIIEENGWLKDMQVVARYTAPATPRASKVGALKLVRSATSLRVGWLPAANAKAYVLEAVMSDGRRIRRVLRKRSYTITGLRPGIAAAVKVKATDTLGRVGPALARKVPAVAAG